MRADAAYRVDDHGASTIIGGQAGSGQSSSRGQDNTHAPVIRTWSTRS